MFKKKKEVEEVDPGKTQSVELGINDVALVLRENGKCETICTLKGKHTLSPQEEVVIGLGSLLQQEVFVNSVRDHFMTTMQNMLSSKYMDEIAKDEESE